MENGIFLGRNCVIHEVPNGQLSYEALEIEQYTGKTADFARITNDGSMMIITEREKMVEALNEGKGVYHQGYVYFLYNTIEENERYSLFKKEMDAFKSNLSHAESYLFEALYEKQYFHMVKNMMVLFTKDVFTYDQILGKLEPYLPKGKAIALLRHIAPNRVAV